MKKLITIDPYDIESWYDAAKDSIEEGNKREFIQMMGHYIELTNSFKQKEIDAYVNWSVGEQIKNDTLGKKYRP